MVWGGPGFTDVIAPSSLTVLVVCLLHVYSHMSGCLTCTVALAALGLAVMSLLLCMSAVLCLTLLVHDIIYDSAK